MRSFSCARCGQQVFFENDRCLRCDAELGYRAGQGIVVLGPADLRCANHALIGCNWLAESPGALCESCVLTRTRPADDDQVGMVEFEAAETAKRRLLFELAELGLPVIPRDEDKEAGLAFELLSSEHTKVVTGHDDGVITLDLAEAEPLHRERLREQLNEPYRTVLGHFRHEIGHYYWPILVSGDDELARCRALFGDDRADYGEAVNEHYAARSDDDRAEFPNWEDEHISEYATMHPYEDWAETFAHYLHILDTLQTAASFGLLDKSDWDPIELRRPAEIPFATVVARWLELTYGLNQVNRSMGSSDLYPFVITARVIDKLTYVDRLVQS